MEQKYLKTRQDRKRDILMKIPLQMLLEMLQDNNTPIYVTQTFLNQNKGLLESPDIMLFVRKQPIRPIRG
jgi:hypothetical protein